MLVTPFRLFEPVPQVTFTDHWPFWALATIVAVPASPAPLGLRVSETEPLLVNTEEVAVPETGWMQVGTVISTCWPGLAAPPPTTRVFIPNIPRASCSIEGSKRLKKGTLDPSGVHLPDPSIPSRKGFHLLSSAFSPGWRRRSLGRRESTLPIPRVHARV